MTKPKRRKREVHYPVGIGVNFPAELGADIAAEAAREDESVSRTVREAVRIGFPLLAERRRKARRRKTVAEAAAAERQRSARETAGEPAVGPEVG